MAEKKRKRTEDFLLGHGMSPLEQHSAVMRASAVPASDFEGENMMPMGTYNSPAAKLLAQKAWESRMRKNVGNFKVEDYGYDDE
jgi:hypothetical protein